MNSKFIKIFFIIIILIIFLSGVCAGQDDSLLTGNYTVSSLENITSNFHYSSNAIFSWPVFGYYSISSYFGYRTSPTTNASTYHSGIDIPAPERNKYICYLFSEKLFLLDFMELMDILLLFKKITFKLFMGIFLLTF